MKKEYDYIVIGGGSAGCVVSARLATESDAEVLLLEGGHSHKNMLLDMPPGIFKMINGSKYMTYHKTESQVHLNNRIHDIPQGNVLGGGSSVNAQVYMRGRPADYNDWDELLGGNSGWGWNQVLSCFKDMEGNNRLLNDFHGCDGPLLVSDPKYITDTSRWFVQSVQALGEPYNDDFNGKSQRGCGFYQFTNRDGLRCSSAYAYIEPIKDLNNLTIKLHASVQKLLIENDKVTGLEYKDSKGTVHTLHAKKEIILSAGALVSPKILMLSGVGDKVELSKHGIDCIVDLPGVGQNLIDHPEVPIVAMMNGNYGYYKQGEGLNMLKNGLQFKLFGTGPVTSAGVEAGAFVNPSDPDADPTIQAFCVPIVYLDRDATDTVNDDYGLTVTTVVVKPKSRGYVKLRSSDPNDMPIVAPKLLSHEDDMQEMVKGQRFFIKAFQNGPLAKRIKSIVLPDINNLTDEAIIEHCKRHVKTNYHPAGTCKMGDDDDLMAVLDKHLKVRGLKNLRVCDMSAAPNINAGNTNAPAMMIGSRCADFILGGDKIS